jgi:hypothetical protein
MDEEFYKLLTPEERRNLHSCKLLTTFARVQTEDSKVQSFHAWITQQRNLLKMDEAVGTWANKPLLYHLKKKPQNFLWAMYIMSMTSHKAGRKAFALFPLRRSHVPRHVRFDQRVVNDVLRLGSALAPVIGAGLMKHLALHFVVAPTPEHYTSNICVECGGLCSAHPTLRTKKNKEIRGTRVPTRGMWPFAKP